MDKIICEADELIKKQYRFNNPWDMECCDQVYSLVNGHTYYTPNSDPEWVYMFSRMEYMRKLILAYIKTNDEKYIESYIEQVHYFYKENNIRSGSLPKKSQNFFVKATRKLKRIINIQILHRKEKISTYRTLDTAIRNYALLCDFSYTKILSNNQNYRKFLLEKLETDIPFTIQELTDFDEYSNWGLIRLTLYVSCSLMLGNNNIDKEIAHIHRLLKNQIKADGGHIECSLMYHMQVLICLLRMLYQMKEHGLYDKEIATYAESMCKYAYYLADQNNYQIMYGDSDYTCIDTIMAIAESVLELDYRMHLSAPTDEILLYEFPNIQIDDSKPILEKVNRVFLDGVYVINELSTQLRCFNEASSSGHKHADNGGIIFYHKGIPVFIDSGRYTYRDVEQRGRFKGLFGHCVSTIDNGEECKCIGGGWGFTD